MKIRMILDAIPILLNDSCYLGDSINGPFSSLLLQKKFLKGFFRNQGNSYGVYCHQKSIRNTEIIQNSTKIKNKSLSKTCL